MTKLYSSLIRCLLLRHIYNLPEYKGKCAKITNLNELPECIKSHFNNLTKLAYEGICKNKYQIIFTEDEIPSDLDTLGLMQSSMELHVDIGIEKSFNFLHLTIQEFLAAHHLLTFSLNEQAKFFNGISETVFHRFLAGLSPLALESAHIARIKLYPNPEILLTMEKIYQIFEAIEIKLPGLLTCYTSSSFHPYQYYMLGSVITNACCKSSHWNVYIKQSSSENIRMFVRGIVSCKDENFQSRLSLHIDVHNNSDIIELCNAPICIDLDLKGLISTYNNVQFDYNNLGCFFQKLSEGSLLLIEHLQFTAIDCTSEVAEKIESFLMKTSSTTNLTIVHSFFNSCILPGKQACDNIVKLHIRHFRGNWNDVDVMLKENKTLREFQVTCTIGFTCLLAESLCANDTLEKLVLQCDQPGDGVDRITSGIPLRIEETSAKIIIGNKSIKELNVRFNFVYNMVDSAHILTEALCKNNTLEKLEIADMIFRVPDAEEFASMLRENTALKELDLSECIIEESKWIPIFGTLTDSLIHNRTLLKFHIKVHPLFQDCDEVISLCARDSRLHWVIDENLRSFYYDIESLSYVFRNKRVKMFIA